MKKMVVLAASLVAALALSAPAFAHFCFKTGWNEAAASHAAGSQAWLTEAEWLAFVDFAVAEGEICPAGADVLRAQLASNPDDALYMGPGLLAGGTLKNGKGNTPDHVGYLDFESAFGACA